MIVHFERVGRDNKTWSEDVGELCEENLLSAIRRKRALNSRDVEFGTEPPEHNTGRIVVGGLRTVGTFRLQPNESA